jgi:hypothetical protein
MAAETTKRATRKPAGPDAAEVLAAAEARLKQARDHFATLRHTARTAHREQADLQAQADQELRAAGLELRPPQGVEQLQNEANTKAWELHQAQTRSDGAERAVMQAEDAVKWALVGVYPERAGALDAAAEKLERRRERVERELAELDALEGEHRNEWRHLLDVLPGGFRVTFTPREYLDTQHSPGMEIPQTLTPTFRPEQGEGLDPALADDPSWPRWLREALARAQTPRQMESAAMTVDAAEFTDAESATALPPSEDDFARELRKRDDEMRRKPNSLTL